MPYDPGKHHRRSIRLSGYDYRDNGVYFVTICTLHRACVFGEIRDGAMKHSRRGLIAIECWNDIPNHRTYVQLDEFVVMPNHVHGILWVDRPDEQRATQVSPLQTDPPAPRLYADSLGAIIGAYKAAVSRTINKLRPGAAQNLWHPNYFEHIVRDEDALVAIREYIRTNLERWDDDVENPVGSAKDDHEQWVRSLIEKHKKSQDPLVDPDRATQVSPLHPPHPQNRP